MTKFFSRFRLAGALAIVCVLATTGCRTVSTSLTAYVGVPKFPPSDPAKVEILQAQPSRPFDKLGEVRASPDDGVSAQKIEDKLRREAAKLGADAVFLVHDQVQVVGSRVWGPAWSPEVSDVSQRLIVVVAIKYRLQ